MVRRSIFIVLFLMSVVSVRADIGETFDLLNKREQVLKENEAILNGRSIDSLSFAEHSRYVTNMHHIMAIDENIFKSQKGTIDRIGNASGSNQHANRSIALFCFALALMLSISIYMLYLLNKELNSVLSEKRTFYSRVREAFSVVLVNFQADPRQKKEVAVNRLIILGMFFMFISVLGYLLATLGV